MQVLRQLPRTPRDPNLLVGAATADDAGVYRLDSRRALVQTVDFFTPIVDDPFAFGQIAAANALSDVYAMGGRPLTALNLMGIPPDLVPPEIIARILQGGASKVAEAGCVLLGGHTIRNPEPIYGLSVTGLVSPRRLLTNAAARPGDLLVLTKPLGTGIATTAIKRGVASARLAKRAIALMSQLNTVGAELAERGLLRAATDITGFGLLGHLASLCRASGTGAEIVAQKVPAISREIERLIAQDCVPGGSADNLALAKETTRFADRVASHRRALLADAQTSGGLLLCVPPRRLEAVLAVLQKGSTPCAAVIGRIVRSGQPAILVQ
jgi:selenide,water dikinase